MSHTGPQTGFEGTQAQMAGELSNCASFAHAWFCTQVQTPPQSAPPFCGSQPSLGSSMQVPWPGQLPPVRPPQRTGGVFGTHWPVVGSQSLPVGQVTAAHWLGTQSSMLSLL